ncbi:diphthine--ammonia ligase isoform X2 [Bombina bombina]|uniref:diphthine--ammonia ligase isoform X2 n=1 Tax=Bombina bombina TaxID=8345 RepID=UPI00235A7887|nr:diphthine--ammonia ligase isoform X2 [Bombina bombina]
MRVVALISGGKDSCYNMMQCVSAGHQIVALANLRPPQKTADELDSYMYQTVGHQALDLYAEAMDLPLYRATLQGTSLETGIAYTPQEGDEVEDLYRLLKLVKEKESVDSVSVGAILSDYQRVRVENVCQRLGLQPLAFLWRRNQEELLDEMISCGVQAILIKVAAYGLDPDKHLGKTLSEVRPHLKKLSDQFGVHVCGEGGEYETLTLDCPLFKKRIIVDSSDVVMHSNDAFAPVAYLRFLKLHLEDKVLSPEPMLKSSCPCDNDRVTSTTARATDEYDANKEQHLSSALQGLPDVILSETKKCSLRSQNGFQWIGEITANGETLLEACQRGLESLKAQVQELGLQMKDAVLIHLYVRNMEDFATINKMYGILFPDAPPSRVCVQCCLPQDGLFWMDGLFWQPTAFPYKEESIFERITMHVQSISHWAPANIGPYSQAVRIGPWLFCAGQIALKPCTMQLVHGGITTEAEVSLQHVTSVLEAVCPGTSISHVLGTHCYVTQLSHIPTAVTAWKRSLAHKGRLSSLSVAVVPQLPRGALVEWHVVAAPGNLAERRVISLSEEGSGVHAEVCGVVCDDGFCAAMTLSLCTLRPGVLCQDWGNISNLMMKALNRTKDSLPTDTSLIPLCCRAFCRINEVTLQSIRTGLLEVMRGVWGEEAPVLVLVPIMDLPNSEILHLSFLFSS